MKGFPVGRSQIWYQDYVLDRSNNPTIEVTFGESLTVTGLTVQVQKTTKKQMIIRNVNCNGVNKFDHVFLGWCARVGSGIAYI